VSDDFRECVNEDLGLVLGDEIPGVVLVVVPFNQVN
jgi:hypothetical protein